MIHIRRCITSEDSSFTRIVPACTWTVFIVITPRSLTAPHRWGDWARQVARSRGAFLHSIMLRRTSSDAFDCCTWVEFQFTCFFLENSWHTRIHRYTCMHIGTRIYLFNFQNEKLQSKSSAEMVLLAIKLENLNIDLITAVELRIAVAQIPAKPEMR